jgi:hypothetical protein
VEHLPETDKHKHKSINPLQDFLGAAQDHAQSMPAIEAPPTVTPLPDVQDTGVRLTMQEYFTEPQDKSKYDGKKGCAFYGSIVTMVTDVSPSTSNFSAH